LLSSSISCLSPDLIIIGFISDFRIIYPAGPSLIFRRSKCRINLTTGLLPNQVFISEKIYPIVLPSGDWIISFVALRGVVSMLDPDIQGMYLLCCIAGRRIGSAPDCNWSSHSADNVYVCPDIPHLSSVKPVKAII
jgi:hypothetical protein